MLRRSRVILPSCEPGVGDVLGKEHVLCSATSVVIPVTLPRKRRDCIRPNTQLPSFRLADTQRIGRRCIFRVMKTRWEQFKLWLARRISNRR